MDGDLKVNYSKLLLVVVFFLLLASPVLAKDSPDLPLALYGKVRIQNEPAPPGSQIIALDARGNLCGSFTTSTVGLFGLLQCMAFNTTGEEIGGLPSENLIIRLNNQPASILLNDTLASMSPVSWASGDFKNITIVQPPLICGDNFCDSYESCASCASDCGLCPDDIVPPERPPAPPGPADLDSLRPLPEELVVEEECVESWSCSPWGECRSNNLQTRECVDLNECGTREDIPVTERECTYIEDVREEVPIREVTPRTEEPAIITTCGQKLPFFSVPSIVFILSTLFLLSIRVIIHRVSMKKLKNNKDLEEVKKLQHYYLIKRKTALFTVTVLVLSLIVYLYHYFFYLCEETYTQHIWLLALAVFLSPLIIYTILELLKYSEKDMKKKIKLLNDTHYLHILKLVKVVNDQLITAETEISNNLYQLDKSADFHELLAKTPAISQIYKDIDKLYKLYKEDRPATKVEKDLLDNISSLESDDSFKEVAKSHPELEKLRFNLSALYKSYEYKQELYDEMLKIEQEFEGKEAELEPEKEEKKEDIAKESKEENKQEVDKK